MLCAHLNHLYCLIAGGEAVCKPVVKADGEAVGEADGGDGDIDYGEPHIKPDPTSPTTVRKRNIPTSTGR